MLPPPSGRGAGGEGSHSRLLASVRIVRSSDYRSRGKVNCFFQVNLFGRKVGCHCCQYIRYGTHASYAAAAAGYIATVWPYKLHSTLA